jgi:hypothetical protein
MQDSNSSSWRQPYLKALNETDETKLAGLVYAAEGSNISPNAGISELDGPSQRTQRNPSGLCGSAKYPSEQARLALSYSGFRCPKL